MVLAIVFLYFILIMPRRQNKKRNNVAKSGALTSGGGGGVATVVYEPWFPIFPASITRKLRYSQTVALSTTAGAITSTQVFRANDLYDPDFSGTGHQPMGFDQMMVWYNHFAVRRAKIIVNFKNTTASPPTVCIRVDADSSAITVVERIIELGACVQECLEVKGSYGANKQLSLSVDICKLQGVNPSALTADANLRGTSAASPAEVSYFHLTMWDTTATTGSCEADVIMEQEAIFFEPRDLTQSVAKPKPSRESKEELTHVTAFPLPGHQNVSAPTPGKKWVMVDID